MKIGDDVYVIDVSSKEGDFRDNFKILKGAYLLKLKGKVLEIIDYEDIIYEFGFNRLRGKIGYNCFATEKEALERINGLNNYFQENHILLKDE